MFYKNLVFWKMIFLFFAVVTDTTIFMIPSPVIAARITELSKAEYSLDNVSNALDVFRLDVGRYPDTEEGFSALYEKPNHLNSEIWPGPYLRRHPPKDQWGQDFGYISPGIHNKNSFDLFSLGRDGIEGTIDDINNWDENKPWRECYHTWYWSDLTKSWYWYDLWHDHDLYIIIFCVILLSLILLIGVLFWLSGL